MSQLLSPVMVGREAELATLLGALDDVLDRRGRAIFVLGEAGIGKSRLVRETATAARQRGMAVLGGGAVPQGEPFRPLSEALIAAARSSGLPTPSELDPFRPALARLIPQWRVYRAGEGGADENRLVVVAEGVLRLLRVLGRERGALLILEDLHWADPETLQVLRYLADHLGAERAACVGTLRSEQNSPARELAHALAGRRAALVLELTRLEDPQVSEMAGACLDTSPPADVCAFLRARADGVPFLVEELLAGLVESGSLVRQESGWVVSGSLRWKVPATFADTVSRRLASLDGAARRVVTAAAVLGRRFDWRLLSTMTGLDEAVVLSSLRRGIELQLLAVEPREGDHFRFRHALTREATLDQLLPPERTALARLAAKVMEVAHPGLPGEWCELAAELHERGGETDRAAELLLEAGRRALRRGALTSAEAALKRAAELGGADLQSEIDRTLLEVLALAGKTHEAFQIGRRLLQALATTGSPAVLRAEVHLRLTRAAVEADRFDLARAELESGRATLVDLGDEAARASIVDLGGEALCARLGPRGSVTSASSVSQRPLGARTRTLRRLSACPTRSSFGPCFTAPASTRTTIGRWASSAHSGRSGSISNSSRSAARV